MNFKEYISSGILEAYVLGELSDEERSEVEVMAATHPEISKELNIIEETIEVLAFKTAINPGVDLKDRIKERVQADKKEKEVKHLDLRERTKVSPVLRYAVAASVTISLITSYMAYNYWNKWKTTEEQLNGLIAQNEQIADDYNLVNQRLEGIENDLEVLGNPDFARITMKGTDNSPNSLTTVYWNSASQDVYLDIQSLKDLSQQNQYQLWAIVDGQPVDIGVFDLSDQLIKMKSIAEATAFAITIEPRGGSKDPNFETMQVLGTVGV